MQNVIDVCIHLLKHTDIYMLDKPITLEAREEALDLCLVHGDEFVITFIENYLHQSIEELG